MPEEYSKPNCTITLYKTKIKREKNMYVDNLSTYLSTCTKLQSTGQYVKHALTVSFKFNILERYQTDFDYNYCAIQNQNKDGTEQVMYYYVVTLEVLNKSTLSVLLVLDVINSLGQGVTSLWNPRNFLANTEITRQHEDRFLVPTTWTAADGGTLIRKFDKESEGVVLEKTLSSDSKVTGSGFDWYLIYRTEDDDDNIVATYLCADEVLNLGVKTDTARTYTAADFDAGEVYTILNAFTKIKIQNGTIYDLRDNTEYCVAENIYALNFKTKQLGTLKGFHFEKVSSDVQFTPIFKMTRTINNVTNQNYNNYVAFDPVTTPSFQVLEGDGYYYGGGFDTVNNTDLIWPYTYLMTYVAFTATTNLSEISSIDKLDRSDSKLIKVIRLPYCPISYSVTEGHYSFASNWEFDKLSGFLKYQITNIVSFKEQNLGRFDLGELNLTLAAADCVANRSKMINAESKLFHSDFHTIKVAFDGFSSSIDMDRLESRTYTQNPDNKFSLHFMATSTINSKFGIKIETSTIGTYKKNQDFENFILVTRNSEETLLNNEYINYIKNGFNYDKKANALQVQNAQRQAAGQTAASAIGAAASILGLIFGEGAVKTASALSLAGSIGTSAITVTNAWNNVSKLQESQQNAMNAKIAQLQAQSTTISGTDDIDLLKWYSDNKAHIYRYDVSDAAKNALYHAFDLTGYAKHKYETPSVDSRIWYNFIQCNPALSYIGIDNARAIFVDELKKKYQEGVTVYHARTGQYDFDQQYENWEKWIVDGIGS